MASNLITSAANPRIKQIRALSRRKERDTTGLCVAEGIFQAGEALASGEVAYLVYAPELLGSDFGRRLVETAEAEGTPVYAVSAGVMAAIADRDNPQGLVAVVRHRVTPLKTLRAATHPWLVALVAPQDPGNLGSILRTIDAVGAAGLILLDGGVDAYHPAAIRAAMGTTFRLPVATATFDEFAAWAGAEAYRVYGTSAHGHTDYRLPDYAYPLVLLMGSEREGLSAAQLARCNAVLRLPMHGRASSLNLSVATGIFLYAMHNRLAG